MQNTSWTPEPDFTYTVIYTSHHQSTRAYRCVSLAMAVQYLDKTITSIRFILYMSYKILQKTKTFWNHSWAFKLKKKTQGWYSSQIFHLEISSVTHEANERPGRHRNESSQIISQNAFLKRFTLYPNRLPFRAIKACFITFKRQSFLILCGQYI